MSLATRPDNITPFSSDWQHQAICGGPNRAFGAPDRYSSDWREIQRWNDWWYPDVGRDSHKIMPQEARDLCAICPVRDECKEAKMREEGSNASSSRWGNAAGMTPFERYQEHRRGRPKTKQT